jgi:hypothetical protein
MGATKIQNLQGDLRGGHGSMQTGVDGWIVEGRQDLNPICVDLRTIS